jgi:CheY-like chemotaxis protein
MSADARPVASAASAALALLYVEDEENDVLFMRRALARAGASCELRSVGDGESAMAYLGGRPPYAEAPRPRLVLLDLNLPGRSGFEVLEWCRAQPALRGLPIVVISSSGRPEDREKARLLGADDYFLKPTSTAHLVEIARTVRQRWLAE